MSSNLFQLYITTKDQASTISHLSDINIITAEINAYQRVVGEAIFEIGRRLKHVKENDLAHGEWSKWCEESLGMNRKTADKLIVVFTELGGNDSTSSQIGISALYEIATLPEPAREQSHTIPSTGETKTVDEMTVRELREVKKALKDAHQYKTKMRTSPKARPQYIYARMKDNMSVILPQYKPRHIPR